MKNKIILIFSLLFLITIDCLAQTTIIKGKITDKETGEPLPYATIVYKTQKGDTGGTTSDLNGYYRLETRDIFDVVEFHYAGYKTQSRTIDRFVTQTFNIRLVSESIELDAVEVKAERRVRYTRKNNPAVELIKKVQANKHANNISAYPYYHYDEHFKLELGISNLNDSLGAHSKASYADIFKDMQKSELTGKTYLSLYLIERLSEKHYSREPQRSKTIIKAVKDVEVSKFFDFSTLEPVLDNMVGEVNIYDPTIFLLNNEYTSPLSSIATTFYHFYISDTTVFKGDSCVVLTFTTANRLDLGLSGVLWIKLDGSYAITKSQLHLPKGSGTNFVESMLYEQEYEFVEGIMRPKGYNLIVDFSYLSLSIHAKKTGVISNFSTAGKPADDFFNFDKEVVREDDYLEKDDDYWAANRLDTLSQHEQTIYDNAEMLNKNMGYRAIINTIMALGYEYFDFGHIDFGPLWNMLSYNDVEGYRLRVSAKTNTNFHKHLFLGGFLAYGTKDYAIKWRAQTMWSFNDKIHHQWEFPMNLLTLTLEHNTYTPGNEIFGSQDYNDPDRLATIVGRGKTTKMTLIDKVRMQYDYEFRYGIGMKFYTEYLEQRSLAGLNFTTFDGKEYRPLNTSTLGLELRYAHNEKFYQLQQSRMQIATSVAPIITLGYNYSAKLFGCDYEFHKATLAFHKKWYLSVLGIADIDVGGGIVFGEAPYPLLYVPSGNQSFFLRHNTFNLMNHYEFVADRYIDLKVTYDMKGFLLHRIPIIGRAKMCEVFGFKAIWGDISEAHDPLNPNHSNVIFPFPTNEKGLTTMSTFNNGPYMEASIGIANIFSILRLDYVRRLSYLDNPDVDEWNIMCSITIQF